MNKKRAGLLLALLCAGAAIAGVFYFAGFQAACRERPALDAQTFYAAISDIRGDTLTVAGMDVNDINFRGEFCFSIVIAPSSGLTIIK